MTESEKDLQRIYHYLGVDCIEDAMDRIKQLSIDELNHQVAIKLLHQVQMKNQRVEKCNGCAGGCMNSSGSGCLD